MTQPPLLVATTDHPICLTKLRTSLGQGEKQDSVGVVGPRPIASPCLITKWVQDPDSDLWSPNEPVGRHVDPLKGFLKLGSLSPPSKQCRGYNEGRGRHKIPICHN